MLVKEFGRRLKRWFALTAVIALCLTAGVQAAPLKVGITQIVEHPALDAARQGFIDGLTELGYTPGEDIAYDIQNAQGDMATAQAIAHKLAADRLDLILAIATPTAQATAHVIKDTPILITAVTDPVAAGLVESIERPGTNVTGTSDLTPVALQLELLQELAPTAQRVGIVYNAGEVNSVVQVQLAREIAAALGLQLVEATVSNSSEVLLAAQTLAGRVDALYVPTDNTVAPAIESMVLVAERFKLPLIVGEEELVPKGALATIGIDYYQLGRQTANIAHRVLQGENPAEIPIQYLEAKDIVLNLGAARRMDVAISDAVLAKAARVIE